MGAVALDTKRELYQLFAELLEYPGAALAEKAERCGRLLSEVKPEAAELVERFAAFAATTPRGSVEEQYTGAFDLNPVCYPYAGYLLFGEDPKRNDLMLKLVETYRETGFDSGDELPDHVAVMFRFLSRLDDGEMERDVRMHLLGPSLEKMSESLEKSRSAYLGVTRAAKSFLGDES